MSRFSNLELEAQGQAPTPGAAPPDGEPIRDKYYFQERAVAAWQAGNFEEALLKFARSLEEDSTFFVGWLGQVRMLIELEEYPEAVVWADKALELFPDQQDLLSAKALALLAQGDVSQAQKLSDAAVAREGLTYYVWLARAEILLARKSSVAQNCIHNAIRSAGNDAPTARLEAGRVLLRAGDAGSAQAYLTEAVQALPHSALAWYELGQCQSALGFREARAAFARCLVLRPSWPKAHAAARSVPKRGLFAWLRR